MLLCVCAEGEHAYIFLNMRIIDCMMSFCVARPVSPVVLRRRWRIMNDSEPGSLMASRRVCKLVYMHTHTHIHTHPRQSCPQVRAFVRGLYTLDETSYQSHLHFHFAFIISLQSQSTRARLRERAPINKRRGAHTHIHRASERAQTYTRINGTEMQPPASDCG